MVMKSSSNPLLDVAPTHSSQTYGLFDPTRRVFIPVSLADLEESTCIFIQLWRTSDKQNLEPVQPPKQARSPRRCLLLLDLFAYLLFQISKKRKPSQKVHNWQDFT